MWSDSVGVYRPAGHLGLIKTQLCEGSKNMCLHSNQEQRQRNESSLILVSDMAFSLHQNQAALATSLLLSPFIMILIKLKMCIAFVFICLGELRIKTLARLLTDNGLK